MSSTPSDQNSTAPDDADRVHPEEPAEGATDGEQPAARVHAEEPAEGGDGDSA